MYSTEKLDKEYILRRISPQDIMSFYLHVEVVIEKDILSPLRREGNPSARFYYDRRGVLILKDYVGHFHGDCFNVVEHLYSESYQEALVRIAADFNLRGSVENKERVELLSLPVVVRDPRVISVKRQAWTEVDRLYWSAFGIKSSTLRKYHVSSISHGWLEDRIFYTYKESDVGYAYYFGKGRYKLYFPMRDSYRFVSNTSTLQGYAQLPNLGEYLVITKSLKDVMLLSQYSIPAVAPSAEGKNLSESLLLELSLRFQHIVVLYDFDYAGIRGARKLRKLGLNVLFLTNGRYGTVDYHAKDLSDFHKRYGEEALSSLLIQTILWHKQSELSHPG
jgi:hypothetical protein